MAENRSDIIKQNTNYKKFVWSSVRGILKKIHLWLALPSALVLTIVCLSGTIYVFNTEVVELLNRNKFFVSSTGTGQSMEPETIIEKIEMETGGKVNSILFPANDKRKWIANVRIEGERRGVNYAINQYNGTFESTANLKGQDFFRWVLRLHRWLLLDRKFGSPIVGWATIIMSLLIFSGFFVWVPRSAKHWKKGLKMKFSLKNKKAFNYNSHKVLGFYAAIFILIMSLTGPHWSFQWYRKGIYDVLGVEMPQRRRPAPQAQAENQGNENRQGGEGRGRERDNAPLNAEKSPLQTISYNEAVQAANKVLGYKGDIRLMVPDENSKSIGLMKNKTGFFAPSGADRLEINRSTGETVELNRFSDRPFNQQIAGSIKALHTGEIFGMFTKILYFIAALIASVLPTTGVIIWLNRLGKKNTSNKKEALAYNTAAS